MNSMSAPVPTYPSTKFMYGSIMLTVSTQLMITYRVALEDMENLLTRLGRVTPTDALDSTFRNVLTHRLSTIPRGRLKRSALEVPRGSREQVALDLLVGTTPLEAARTVDNGILSGPFSRPLLCENAAMFSMLGLMMVTKNVRRSLRDPGRRYVTPKITCYCNMT